MPSPFITRLNQLSTNITPHLKGLQRGMEKEGLRIKPSGYLADTPHPKALGSTLTHPYITTDYSEALLEFITPVFDTPQGSLNFLEDVHRYTYQHINDEVLWVNSMPCIMQADNEIPIAQYGSSNIAKMKEIYREGLGQRYGRRMQTIAGIHYNLSFPDSLWNKLKDIEKDQQPKQDFISSKYFGLIRNFHRYGWLLLYLFGASPAMCASFLRGRVHQLEENSSHTLFASHGTSLRMSDLGYQNNAQAGLNVCYNHIDSYVKTLTNAIKTPHPAYEAIGIKDGDHYKQLNANLLQIENEYYSSIRPKRNTEGHERPTLALQRRGVEYIEIRCTDLDPFTPLGIEKTQMYFLDTFATYCLLKESPELMPHCYTNIQFNLKEVVSHGRKPQLNLQNASGEVSLVDWSTELLEEISAVATLLDEANNTTAHLDSVKKQQAKIFNSSLTPSAKVIDHLQEKSNDASFFSFAMDLAKGTKNDLMNNPLSKTELKDFTETAANSITKQSELEDIETGDFESFLAAYFED